MYFAFCIVYPALFCLELFRFVCKLLMEVSYAWQLDYARCSEVPDFPYNLLVFFFNLPYRISCPKVELEFTLPSFRGRQSKMNPGGHGEIGGNGGNDGIA